jgi:hypothetical protein
MTSAPQPPGDPAPPPLAADISEVPVTYKTPADALEAVRADFLYWSGKLTDTSFELSLALIAANWAVFGSVTQVLENGWAKASLFFVVLSLGINLAGSKWMSEMLRHRYEYAESGPSRWAEEFKENHGKRVSWPFTDNMEFLGRLLRECKTWLPLLSGILFLIGLVSLP